MFTIEVAQPGVVAIRGRLDAAQAIKAGDFLDQLDGVFVIDLEELVYVSSAGLGVFLQAHKLLQATGGSLRLINVGPHIADILRYSGFDKLFQVEQSNV